jgi:hypothetical protein
VPSHVRVHEVAAQDRRRSRQGKLNVSDEAPVTECIRKAAPKE